MGTVMAKTTSNGVEEESRSSNLPVADVPEDCLACMFSYLSPRDVCRLALVNRSFFEASRSDLVWERMLPLHYREALAEAGIPIERFTSKRQLYDALCEKILFKDGKQALWLDRATGGMCYALSARALDVCWGSDSRYWEWHSQHGSRFHEVAYLRDVCWFDVKGSLRCYLQPGAYTVSFRLLLGDEPSNLGLHRNFMVSHVLGWNLKPVKFSLSTSDGQHTQTERYLDCTEVPESKQLELSNLSLRRIVDDDWVEYDIGEFDVKSTNTPVELQFSMTETEGAHWKSGLFLDGVVVRPSFLIPNLPNSDGMKV